MVVVACERHAGVPGILPDCGTGDVRAAPVAHAVAGDAAAEVAGFEGGGPGGGVWATDGIGVHGEREEERYECECELHVCGEGSLG